MTPEQIERTWRDVGLPEWFLGNGGTNIRLYDFAGRIAALSDPSPQGVTEEMVDKALMAAFPEYHLKESATLYESRMRRVLEQFAATPDPSVQKMQRTPALQVEEVALDAWAKAVGAYNPWCRGYWPDDREAARKGVRAVIEVLAATPAPQGDWVMVPRTLSDEIRFATWYAQYKHGGGTDEEATQLATEKVNDQIQKAQDTAAYAATLAAASAPAPQGGWVLVPREPTEAMLDTYWHQAGESKEMRARTHTSAKRYYAAMLASAHAPVSIAEEREEPDWWYRDMDPDDAGDIPDEAMRNIDDFDVQLLQSSYTGPAKFAVRLPLLTDDEDAEVLLFDTAAEAQAAAHERAAQIRARKP